VQYDRPVRVCGRTGKAPAISVAEIQDFIMIIWKKYAPSDENTLTVCPGDN